jgi:hypothetical protein
MVPQNIHSPLIVILKNLAFIIYLLRPEIIKYWSIAFEYSSKIIHICNGAAAVLMRSIGLSQANS